MLLLWQVAVGTAATYYMLCLIADRTPFFVAIAAALLVMSVAASPTKDAKDAKKS